MFEHFPLRAYGDDSALQPGQMIWQAIDAADPAGYGKSIEVTARETNHSPADVTRYINDF